MGFNLDDYETVATRLEKFWKDYPDGRVQTEIISFTGNQYIFKASLYKTYMDSIPFSTGFAEESVSAKGVNSTSALENCETSAIGRALANGNLTAQAKGLSFGKRPSREEMSKVTASTTAPSNAHHTDPWGIAPQDQAHHAEPKTLADGISIVEDILGGEPQLPATPLCEHGEMRLKQGTKNGKPWLGFVCGMPWTPEMPDSFKCKPIWAHLMGNHWVLPKAAE